MGFGGAQGDGRMREYEAYDCPGEEKRRLHTRAPFHARRSVLCADVDSIHNDYQRHLPYVWLFPEFETQKLREWATGQQANGEILEYLGAFGLGPLDQVGASGRQSRAAPISPLTPSLLPRAYVAAWWAHHGGHDVPVDH